MNACWILSSAVSALIDTMLILIGPCDFSLLVCWCDNFQYLIL